MLETISYSWKAVAGVAEDEVYLNELQNVLLLPKNMSDKAIDNTVEGISGVMHLRDDYTLCIEGTMKNMTKLYWNSSCGASMNVEYGHNLSKCNFRGLEIQFYSLVFSAEKNEACSCISRRP